jgi:hypothetical protein
VRSLWAKRLNAKDIHKEMFPVYCGKCLSREVVHSWVKKVSQGRSKVPDNARRRGEVVDTTVKILYSASFAALVKRWDKCINAGGGHVKKKKYFFQVRISYVLRLYPFVTYLLTVPRTEY